MTWVSQWLTLFLTDISMDIVETPIFTRQINKIMPDDLYKDLQWELVKKPTIGAVIQNGNGLRKIRWKIKIKGKGKSGGVRVIYYIVNKDLIMMLLCYKKNEIDNLSDSQLNKLREIIKESFG